VERWEEEGREGGKLPVYCPPQPFFGVLALRVSDVGKGHINASL